jgi:hypothetical protein
MVSKDIDINQNEFHRQFEAHLNQQLITLEYADNDRNMFLTKVTYDKEKHDEERILLFIKAVLDYLKEKEVTVVPTSPLVKKFIKRNKLKYKKMLPIGMAI